MLTVEQIITQLNTDDSLLPREALEQAILQQEAITPALLDIIENVAKAPHSVNDTPAFIYALCLLAQFREKKAYPLIVQYFGEIGMEYQALDSLGYLVTECLSDIFASVCQGLMFTRVSEVEIHEVADCTGTINDTLIMV